MTVILEDTEANQLCNILANTREFAWVITNPLLMKIGAQLQANRKGNVNAGGQEQAKMANGDDDAKGITEFSHA